MTVFNFNPSFGDIIQWWLSVALTGPSSALERPVKFRQLRFTVTDIGVAGRTVLNPCPQRECYD